MIHKSTKGEKETSYGDAKRRHTHSEAYKEEGEGRRVTNEGEGCRKEGVVWRATTYKIW